MILCDFFFQAEDGIRDLVRSRGLGDVYKRQRRMCMAELPEALFLEALNTLIDLDSDWIPQGEEGALYIRPCLLYTSDAADERSSVDLGGRRIIKKTKTQQQHTHTHNHVRQRGEDSRVAPKCTLDIKSHRRL